MKAIENNKLNIPQDNVILGDAAFPLKCYLMKPYPSKFQQPVKEKVFNYRLSRARRVVENAFGILSSRFRIFRKPILLSPETTIKLTKAACALHNWIRKSNCINSITVDIEDQETRNIIPGTQRTDSGSDNLLSLSATQDRNFVQGARRKRDELADFFMGDGAVQWQYHMIQ